MTSSTRAVVGSPNPSKLELNPNPKVHAVLKTTRLSTVRRIFPPPTSTPTRVTIQESSTDALGSPSSTSRISTLADTGSLSRLSTLALTGAGSSRLSTLAHTGASSRRLSTLAHTGASSRRLSTLAHTGASSRRLSTLAHTGASSSRLSTLAHTGASSILVSSVGTPSSSSTLRVSSLGSSSSTVRVSPLVSSSSSGASRASIPLPARRPKSDSELTPREKAMKILELKDIPQCIVCGQPATPEYATVPGFWSKLFVCLCCPCLYANCRFLMRTYEKMLVPAFICPECKSEVAEVPKDFDPTTYPFHHRK